MNLEAFVDAWVDAYKKKLGVPAVAQKMDIPVERASSQANYLRKKGVHLPPMPRSRSASSTIEQLNQRIEKRIAQAA
jgi:hypothetical protein